METDEEKVSEGMATYLNEKFPKPGEDNSEISDYLNNKFDTHDLPGGNKRKQTIPEMIAEIKNRR